MVWGAVAAGVGAGIVGGYFDRQEGRRDRAADAEQQRLDRQERQGGRRESTAYGEERRAEANAALNPYMQSGVRGNKALEYAMGLGDRTGGAAGAGDYGSLNKRFSLEDFETAPGYQFRLSEGNKAIERLAGRGGSPYSGATLKALARFNQNTASEEYGSAYERYDRRQSDTYNRLLGLSEQGRQATDTYAQVGSAAADRIAAQGGTGEEDAARTAEAEAEAAAEAEANAARRRRRSDQGFSNNPGSTSAD